MKILSTISFIFLIELIYLTKTILSSNLYHLNRYESKVVDFPTTESSLDKRESSNDMFSVNFHCSNINKTLCDKTKNVFVKAGKYITATLNLKKPIIVSAQFSDYLDVLANSGPTEMFHYKDSDGKLRLYPSTLLKQLSKISHPRSDINITLNLKINYWFEGDPVSILGNQYDILLVVLHELIHGLGFTSSWDDYVNKALTPKAYADNLTPGVIVKNGESSPQFYEYVFDEHLVLLSSRRPLTSITDELNQFKSNLPKSFLSEKKLSAEKEKFLDSFANSPQFQIAQDMYKNATTHGTIGFLLTPDSPSNTQLSQDQINNDVVVLETNSNYVPGSSIMHVDLNTYSDTSDFLMVRGYHPGVTLDNMMFRFGSTNSTGPIGPKLRRILGVMGYEIKNNYSPPNFNSSSFIKFNFVLSLVCTILLAFIFK